VIIVLQREEAG